MKRLTVVFVALLALLAFGAVTASAKNKTKTVATSVTVTFSGTAQDGYGQYGQGTFSGQVTANKGCQKNRTVSLQKVGGAAAGVATSNDSGAYSITPTSPVTSGQYTVTVEEKKIKKKKKSGKKVKIKCQSATANVTVP